VGSRAELIVRSSHASTVPQGWDVDDISLEELILAYLRQPESSMMATPLTIAAAYASGASL
jgi:hypothetical protein